jgi:hypothetical protein
MYIMKIGMNLLKVLSNGTGGGGGVWVVSIDGPMIRQHFRRFKKKFLKDPGPLKNKKPIWAA